LSKKLGYEAGARVHLHQPPAHYRELLGALPPRVSFEPSLRGRFLIMHLFFHGRAELARRLPRCLAHLHPDGAIWVSWPKKTSALAGDLDENSIRVSALPLGLVDVKVCAVDENWSGLKLVIRKELREKIGRGRLRKP
jgi:hypothetical protein